MKALPDKHLASVAPLPRAARPPRSRMGRKYPRAASPCRTRACAGRENCFPGKARVAKNRAGAARVPLHLQGQSHLTGCACPRWHPGTAARPTPCCWRPRRTSSPAKWRCATMGGAWACSASRAASPRPLVAALRGRKEMSCLTPRARGNFRQQHEPGGPCDENA